MNVIDASVVVAALTEDRQHAGWAREVLSTDAVGPAHLPVEVANALRGLEMAARVGPDVAGSALEVLTELALELWPFAPLAARVWELRSNLTPYDAWYVALAETLDAPLATLDVRLVRAPGPRCEFMTPFAH